MPTIQRAGKITLVIFCDPDWTPCQKAQARAKAADLNHQAGKNALTRDPNYGAATEAAKQRAQTVWTREFNRVRATGNVQPHAELGTKQNNYPSGFEEDFTDPCMEQEMVNGQVPTHQDSSGRTVSNWAADHRTECVAGGSTQGPMKMLDSSVNSSFGPAVAAAVTAGPVHAVEVQGCD